MRRPVQWQELVAALVVATIKKIKTAALANERRNLLKRICMFDLPFTVVVLRVVVPPRARRNEERRHDEYRN